MSQCRYCPNEGQDIEGSDGYVIVTACDRCARIYRWTTTYTLTITEVLADGSEYDDTILRENSLDNIEWALMLDCERTASEEFTLECLSHWKSLNGADNGSWTQKNGENGTVTRYILSNK